eukprot:s1539_g15.t2
MQRPSLSQPNPVQLGFPNSSVIHGHACPRVHLHIRMQSPIASPLGGIGEALLSDGAVAGLAGLSEPGSPVSQAWSSVRQKRQDSPLKKLGVVTPARHCWTRVPFFTKWINSLCMYDPGWTMVDEDNFFEELKSGLVLCKVVERLVPGADLTTKGIYHKPRTRATCVANIDSASADKALTVAWRTGVNAGHMCSADDIYDCKITAVTRCISELFDALQMRLREVRSRSRDMLTSMNAHLIPIGCGLSERTLNDPVQHCDALVADFADCTKIMALLVSTGKASVEDLLSLAHREQCFQRVSQRTSGAEGAQLKGLLQENGRILSGLLEANGCPVLLGPGEFANPPSPFPDTILLQLHIIWRSVGGGAPGATGLGQPAQSPVFHSASPGGVGGSKAELQLWMQAMSAHFNSLDDAFWSWCGNMSGRMSQSTFMRAMREINYQGDAKLVWDTLNRGVPGFISQEDFARPELEATFAQVLQPEEGEEARNFVAGAEAADEADGEVVEDTAEDQQGADGADDQAAAETESISFVVLPLADEGDIDLAQACRLAGDEEPRLSGASEERLRMLSEDVRRQQDLQENGATSAARLVTAAAAAAAAAASSLVSAEALQIGDLQSFPLLPDLPVFSDFKKESVEFGDEAEAMDSMDAVSCLLSELSVHELPTPTTSVDTRVVMSDGSECRAWLQTNVVDSPQENHLQQASESPVLVLEVWVLHESTNASLLISQVNCSCIVEVLQHGVLSASDLAFEITFKPGADLLQSDPQSWAIAKTVNAREGRQRPSDLRERILLDNDVRRQTSIFSVLQKESSLPTFAAGLAGQQVSLRCSFAQAPSWSRLEAVHFFDELRILSRFAGPACKKLRIGRRQWSTQQWSLHFGHPARRADMRVSLLSLLVGVQVWDVRGESPKGFVWMSQGFGLPPTWLSAIPEMPETWLVWGSFGLCDRTLEKGPRFLHVCLPEVDWSFGRSVRGNMTYTPGRNLLYQHALQLELDESMRFLYFILADDSGEFIFRNCSPLSCGNSDVLPAAFESPASFFHRLLVSDMPAIATPVFGIDDADCVGAADMRVCTSTIDHKVIALHWSVHPALLPYEESFEQISLFASQCIVNELADASFRGYSVHYRMFQRPTTSKSSFPSMRPHYVRSLEPCLPQVLSNGSFADSAVVKWLRPQLRACATERLGPSFLLQSECEPGSSPNERCNLPKRPFDYREVVCASPWAKREDCHGQGRASEGKFRPPRPSGVHHVLRLQRSFGAGAPRAPSKASGSCASGSGCLSNPSCALELLCAAGMQNFSRLLDARTQSLDSSLDLLDSLAECWKVAEPHLQRLLQVERHEVDHECDACVAVLLGAYVDPKFLSAGLSTTAENVTTRQSFWNWWWCVVAFLHRSQIRLFASGSVAPFDMLLFLTEKLLPAERRPGIDAFSTADALEQLVSVERPFAVNEPASKCLMGLAVRHLSDALQDVRWAAGHVFAAQHYLAHCA